MFSRHCIIAAVGLLVTPLASAAATHVRVDLGRPQSDVLDSLALPGFRHRSCRDEPQWRSHRARFRRLRRRDDRAIRVDHCPAGRLRRDQRVRRGRRGHHRRRTDRQGDAPRLDDQRAGRKPRHRGDVGGRGAYRAVHGHEHGRRTASGSTVVRPSRSARLWSAATGRTASTSPQARLRFA